MLPLFQDLQQSQILTLKLHSYSTAAPAGVTNVLLKGASGFNPATNYACLQPLTFGVLFSRFDQMSGYNFAIHKCG